MRRFARDSDDDVEPRERVRLLSHSAVNSPSLRRSSRIKQNRSSSVSPGSDTNSISSNQSIRVTRQRTAAAAIDSALGQIPKERRSRKASISSDISEAADLDTPSKRITRKSTSSLTTPTKMNTRSSKRFVRAGSETRSPSSAVRVMRTRASSVDPESFTDRPKSQTDTPTKVRKRASVLPINSPVKEEVEEHLIPYVRLDFPIFEKEELAHSTSSDSSVNLSSRSRQSHERRKTVDKDKAEKESEHDEVALSPTVSTGKTSENDSETHDNSKTSSVCKTLKRESSPRNMDFSLDKSSSAESKDANETSTDKDKIKDDDDHDKPTSSSAVSQSDEAFNLPEKSEIFNKSNNADAMMDNKENIGDLNYLPDMVSQSQASQKIIKRRRSSNKDVIEKSDDFVEEKKSVQSEDKIETHDSHDKGSLNEKQRRSCPEISLSSSDDDVTILISNQVSFLETEDASEYHDNNDDKLVSGRQSIRPDADEISSDMRNLDGSAKLSADTVSSSSADKMSDDQLVEMAEQSGAQSDAPESLDPPKGEGEPQKNIEELNSSDLPERQIETPSDCDKVLIARSANVSVDFVEEAPADSSSEKGTTKGNMKNNSMDNQSDDLEAKNVSRPQETDEDVIVNIIDSDSESNPIATSGPSNVPAGTQVEKTSNVESSSDESDQECNLQPTEKEQDNESEAECDLVLVDKRAWLAAEDMKAAREIRESSECDSDDTVVKKSKLDATRANATSKMLDIISEEVSTLLDVEEINAKKKSRKHVDSTIAEPAGDYSKVTDESLDGSKMPDSDQSSNSSRLNKSKRTEEAARPRPETDESDGEAGGDAEKLNRSSRTSRESRKSLWEKKSLKKSSKDASFKQSRDCNVQDANECEAEEKSTVESNVMEVSPNERRSSNKSYNDTAEERKPERKKSLLSSADDGEIKKRTSLKNSKDVIKPFMNTDESNDSEIVDLQVMDIGIENYSTIAHAGSTIEGDNSDDGGQTDNDTSDSIILSSFIFTKPTSDNECHLGTTDNDSSDDNNSDKDSVNSDIRREYNLDGAEQKFDDDDVLHDECRASESEYSDPNDNGTDLEDFIVEDDEEENKEDDDLSSNKDNEDEEQEDDDDDEEKEEEQEQEQEEINEDAQSEEENNEREMAKRVAAKTKKRKKKAKRDVKEIAEVDEYVTNEDEDADDEQSEVEVNSDDGSESNEEDESLEIIDAKREDDSVEIVSSRIGKMNGKRVAEVKTSRAKKIEETVVLDETTNMDVSDNSKKKKKKNSHVEKIQEVSLSSDSPSSIRTKRKSLLRSFGKLEKEQDFLKQLDEPVKSQFSRKQSKLHAQMECSTPKFSPSRDKSDFHVQMNSTFEKIQERKSSKDSDTKSESQNTSSEKTILRSSAAKKNTSLTDFIHRDEHHAKESLNTSLPLAIVQDAMGKLDLSKQTVSKAANARKTINIADTESPTIRHLRKEKLNESSPILPLLESNRSKNKSSNIEEEATAEPEVQERNDEGVPSLEPASKITRKRKRQRKHEEHADETPNENTAKALFEDTMELETSYKKKRAKLSETVNVEDDKDTPRMNEEKKEKKKKKKKKEQLDASNQSVENVEEVETQQNDRNETETTERKKKKKKKKVKTSNIKSESPTKDHHSTVKNSEQQEPEVAQSEEAPPEKSSRKKKKKKQRKEEETPLLEAKTKSKSPDLEKPRSTETNSIESRNEAFAKARREAREAIRSATMRILADKESKKEQQNTLKVRESERLSQKERSQGRIAKINRKRKREEERAFMPSSAGSLQRLPDDVIENLADVPSKAAKRKRLLLQTEKPIVSPQSKKARKAASKDIQLSSSGSTTQFVIKNLQTIEKQPSKGSAAVASLRQRMLDRNKREPVSAYLMYLEKQRASSKNKGPSNPF